MRTKLTIGFAPAEGAIPRLLRLIERRGFEIMQIQMSPERLGNAACLTLEIDPRDSSRNVRVLAEQLRRAHEVTDISHPDDHGASACPA